MGESLKTKQQKRMGRPLAQIDKQQFEQMCRIHCTLNEIAGVFMVEKSTIERWSKKTYGRTFADVRDDFASQGKMSLRREMFKKALGGHAGLQIWLSKQHLDMKDKIESSMDERSEEITRLAYSLPKKGDEE
jgi:hypothetical protein